MWKLQTVQDRIRYLLGELEQWAAQMMPDNIHANRSNQKSDVTQEHLLLKMYYYSTKIIITRPCLCRTEQRIKNESNTSADFNAKSSAACVEAARQMTALFPGKPDPKWIYRMGPWWSIVHNSK
jgi:hypothetical protein